MLLLHHQESSPLVELDIEHITGFVESNTDIYPVQRIIPLAGDGSDRRFFNIEGINGSCILIVHPPVSELIRRENNAFAAFSRHLFKLKLPVPKLHAEDQTLGWFLAQYLGNLHVQDIVARYKNVSFLKTLYNKIIALLIDFHARTSENFDSTLCLEGDMYDPCFVMEKELEYFRKSFLKAFLSLNVRWAELRDAFSYLSEHAGVTSTEHVIHRDFQSRNLMVHNGKVYIIDYQGMRYGPPEYDIASLYLDPYVGVIWSERKRWVCSYASRAPYFTPQRFHAVSLCRNLQILAAFAHLTINKKKYRFLNYVPQAWNSLRRNPFLRNTREMKSLLNVLDKATPMLQKSMDRFTVTCYSRTAQTLDHDDDRKSSRRYHK